MTQKQIHELFLIMEK